MDTSHDPAQPNNSGDMSMFRPPIVRSAAVLNRALFSKSFDLAAARVNDVKNISKYRQALSKSRDLFHLDRISPIVNDPEQSPASPGGKCLLLRPDISPTGMYLCNVTVL